MDDTHSRLPTLKIYFKNPGLWNKEIQKTQDELSCICKG